MDAELSVLLESCRQEKLLVRLGWVSRTPLSRKVTSLLNRIYVHYYCLLTSSASSIKSEFGRARVIPTLFVLYPDSLAYNLASVGSQ